MYIAIYICVIAVVCVGICGLFVLKNKKDKQRLEKINKSEPKIEDVKVEETVSLSLESALVDNKEQVTELKIETETTALPKVEEVDLQDFSIDDDKAPVVEAPRLRTRPFINPFKFEEETGAEEEDVDFDFEEDDKALEERFASYEKFLRENVDDEDLDIQDEPQNEDEKFEGLGEDFDIDKFKDKSKEEILEMIKTLPPKVQELLLTNVLAKKEYEDKEDE